MMSQFTSTAKTLHMLNYENINGLPKVLAKTQRLLSSDQETLPDSESAYGPRVWLSTWN